MGKSSVNDVVFDEQAGRTYELIMEGFDEDVPAVSEDSLEGERPAYQARELEESLEKMSDGKLFLKGMGEGLWEIVGPGVKLNLTKMFGGMAEVFKAALLAIRNIVRGSNEVHANVSDEVVRQRNASLDKLEDEVVEEIMKTPVRVSTTTSLKLVSNLDIAKAENAIVSVKERVLNVVNSPAGKAVKFLCSLGILVAIPMVTLYTAWGYVLITMAKTALILLSAFVMWNAVKETLHMIYTDSKLDFRKLGRLSVLLVVGFALGSLVPVPGITEMVYGKGHIITNIMDFSLFGVVTTCFGAKGLSRLFEVSTNVGKRIIAVIQDVLLLITDKKSSVMYKLHKMDASYLIPDIFFSELYKPLAETSIGKLTNALVLGPDGAKTGDVSPALMMYRAVKTQVDKQIRVDVVNMEE